MLSEVIYIGMAQCIFASILVFSKRPLFIADKILGTWLFSSSLLFIYLVLKDYLEINGYIWQISFLLTITFPIFLLLYTKYITTEQQRFKKRDLIYFTPLFLILVVIIMYYIFDPIEFLNFNKIHDIWPMRILGVFFYVCIWVYSGISIYHVIQYKKQINHSYSFDSHKINLSWLLIVIIFYFITYNFLYLIVSRYIKLYDYKHLLSIINSAQLVFIYILSYFGFMQQQLHIDRKSVKLEYFSIKESNPNIYQKSGLKDTSKVEENLKTLINIMNTSEPWKDLELSVAKLSELSGIPKHHITQILNDNLQKNFYTFVNEYRTEYAKSLLISPQHKNWSIVAIAFESGFNSKAAFNNFFKKYTGMTPTSYKEKQAKINL